MQEGVARVSVDVWACALWYCPACDTMNHCSPGVEAGEVLFCDSCGTPYNISEVKG